MTADPRSHLPALARARDECLAALLLCEAYLEDQARGGDPVAREIADRVGAAWESLRFANVVAGAELAEAEARR